MPENALKWWAKWGMIDKNSVTWYIVFVTFV